MCVSNIKKRHHNCPHKSLRHSWYKWRHICTAMQGQLYITWLDNTIASLSNWPWYDRDMLKRCALYALAQYPICTTFVKKFWSNISSRLLFTNLFCGFYCANFLSSRTFASLANIRYTISMLFVRLSRRNFGWIAVAK